MRTPRFILAPESLLAGTATISGADLRHARVLRLRPGDGVRLCDGRGREYAGEVVRVLADRIEVRQGGELRNDPEPLPAVSLFQGLARGDKIEFVLQKATELGIARFVPVASERSTLRPAEARTARLRRWQEIARQAARQSERTRVPEVSAPCAWPAALAEARQADLAVMPYEGSGPGESWKARLAGRTGIRSLALLVGPEGGFTEAELAQALAAGVIPVSLGPRILRSETAGLAATALAMFCWGDLGGTTG